MDMREFITKLDNRNFRLANLHTYIQDDMNHCSIIVTERGDKGTFFKKDCPYYNIDNALKSLLVDIDRLRQTKK